MADSMPFGFGALPGELAAQWPKCPDGEYVTPAFLTNCPSNDLADVMLINMLQAYGIPCLRVYPGDGAFGRVVLGMSGTGSSILVPETMLEDAKNLMEAECDDEEQN